MRKYCGRLTTLSQARVLKQGQGLTIAQIRIGNKTLTNAKVDGGASEYLQADPNREVCLYVFNVMLTPNILGVKFMDTGEKHLVSWGFCRGSCIRYAVLGSLGFAAAGYVVGMVLAGLTGSPFSSLPGIGALGGVALALWYSFKLMADYARAKAD